MPILSPVWPISKNPDSGDSRAAAFFEYFAKLFEDFVAVEQFSAPGLGRARFQSCS